MRMVKREGKEYIYWSGKRNVIIIICIYPADGCSDERMRKLLGRNHLKLRVPILV